jgi:hypothetical protein
MGFTLFRQAIVNLIRKPLRRQPHQRPTMPLCSAQPCAGLSRTLRQHTGASASPAAALCCMAYAVVAMVAMDGEKL